MTNSQTWMIIDQSNLLLISFYFENYVCVIMIAVGYFGYWFFEWIGYNRLWSEGRHDFRFDCRMFRIIWIWIGITCFRKALSKLKHDMLVLYAFNTKTNLLHWLTLCWMGGKTQVWFPQVSNFFKLISW